MSNLLPLSARKKTYMIYLTRLGTVLLVAVVIVMVIGTTFLLPSIFLTSVKKDRLVKQIAIIESAVVTDDAVEIEKNIEETSMQLAVLARGDDMFLSSAFNAILEEKGPGIEISRFFFQEGDVEDRTEHKIIINGEAQNRDVLLSFGDRLKQGALFSSVYLPVSSLVKSQDISFIITLVPAPYPLKP